MEHGNFRVKFMSENDEHDNIESTIQKLSAKTSAFNRKNLAQFGSNFIGFFRFYGEVLTENLEAECYPIYFLPSLVIVLSFGLMLSFATFSICGAFEIQHFFSKMILTICAPIAVLSGFGIGMKISALIFKAEGNFQDFIIALGIFSTPLLLGAFLFWMLEKIALPVGIFLLFATHSTAVLSLYSALPKILLMKGLSRFLTILISLGMSIFSVSLLLRMVL